jgi:hypothetical protein
MSRPRPIVVLEYTGPKNRYAEEYQRALNARTSGQLNPVEYRTVIERLNALERAYRRAGELRRERYRRAAEEKAEMARQEQAFLRIVEARAKKEREAEEKRRALERFQAQVEAERVARERRLQKARATYAQKKAEARKTMTNASKVFRDTIVYNEKHTAETFWGNEDPIYEACKRLEGLNQMYVQILRNGKLFHSGLINIQGVKSYSIYYEKVRPLLFNGYSGGEYSIFSWMYDILHLGSEMEPEEAYRLDETNPIRVRIILSRAQEIPAKRIVQSFRAGEKHCVLEPLLMLFQSYLENCESKSSKIRYTTVVNRIHRLLEEYDSGVPEEMMEDVAKAVYRCFVIYDVLGNETMRYNSRSTVLFHFTNTRENHLEAGHITMDKQYVSVSQEELAQILREHDEAQEFYLFRGDISNKIPQSLRSKRGAWAVFHEDYEVFQEFNKKVGVRDYRINAVKYPVVNDFIKDGRFVHAGAVALGKKPNQMDGATHYDMKKAYTQHQVSPYFSGFLGHVQQWAMLTGKGLDFVREHLGMFRFRVVSLVPLLSTLGMYVGEEYTLPGPELLYLCDVMGLGVELVAGLWGSRAEIEYTPEMLENRRYCTWAGKLGMESSVDTYLFKGSYDWACHLKAELGEDRVSFWGDFICVKNPKGAVWTTHHLLAFITSYSRINMFEMMRRVDGELLKVVLDGLYFRGSMNTDGLAVVFSEKEKMTAHTGFTKWYYASSAVLDWEEYSPMLDGSCVLAGAGGTGKSYRVFNDKSLYQPLYVVPSHVLGRKFRNEYGVSYTTIHKLIGVDCRPYKEDNGAPHNIFVDELTMIEAEWIKKAIAMYPTSRFYIAGDVDGKQWFQCRNGGAGNYSEIWIPSRSEWRYVDFTVDMRSKDEELKVFKSQLRDVMRGVFTDGGMKDAYRINTIVRNTVKVHSFDEAVSMFHGGDIWIAGTHQTNRRLLDAGVVSGYINARKEIVEEEGGEKRGAFTCHSFQGLTIPDKRVFISLDMFEYAMLYTAVSRVCRFEQLVFVA